MVLARRLRIVGTPVDWILEVSGGEADPIIAVVPTGERTDDCPYNEHFEFPKEEVKYEERKT